MKILVTGGSGLLGQYLNLELTKKYNLVTTYHSVKRNCSDYFHYKLNLESKSEIVDLLKKEKPNIVIHAGAVSNSILADKLGTKLTNKVNIDSTKLIAQLCSEINSKLIFISTDLVYDGNSGMLLSESSKLNPVTLYAESKLKAETEVQNYSSNYIILRQALMFGNGLNGSQNFYTTMIDNLKTGKPVNLFTDQFRTPLELSDSARMISELLDKEIKNEILNFGGVHRISRFYLGELVCEKYGFDKNLLIKTKMSEIHNYTAVNDVSMNTEKLKSYGVVAKSIFELL